LFTLIFLRRTIGVRRKFIEVLACSSDVCNYITRSPKHLDDRQTKETHMTTQISTKLTALAVALMMNTLLIGGVALLFTGQLPTHNGVVSIVHAGTTLKATL
jgi:hypothetical protein